MYFTFAYTLSQALSGVIYYVKAPMQINLDFYDCKNDYFTWKVIETRNTITLAIDIDIENLFLVKYYTSSNISSVEF